MIHRNTCDRDTSGFTGDPFIMEASVNNPKICRTQYCNQKFIQSFARASQTYSSLSLPFKSINGTSVNISMVLCKYGQIFSGVFYMSTYILSLSFFISF